MFKNKKIVLFLLVLPLVAVLVAPKVALADNDSDWVKNIPIIGGVVDFASDPVDGLPIVLLKELSSFSMMVFKISRLLLQNRFLENHSIIFWARKQAPFTARLALLISQSSCQQQLPS